MLQSAGSQTQRWLSDSTKQGDGTEKGIPLLLSDTVT